MDTNEWLRQRARSLIKHGDWQGIRHQGTTFQTTKAEARLVEAAAKKRLRLEAGDLLPATAAATPRFAEWAEVAIAHRQREGRVRRLDAMEATLRMVLRFWGAPSATPTRVACAVVNARRDAVPSPYHDLRLGDPIADPRWLERFEQWMSARAIGGSARNAYLAAVSDLYRVARQPAYRHVTGITANPIDGITRSRTRPRVVALPPETIVALVAQAPAHLARAICLAALAPKLRMRSILALEWGVHLDADLTRITVAEHKTSGATGRPQVVPISATLRAILTTARAQAPTSPYVIAYTGRQPRHRGQPLRSVRQSLRTAVEALGLPWGVRTPGGVTFHALRHSIATLLATPALVGALPERVRADVMGHADLATTQRYTHLAAAVQLAPHEAIAAALPGLEAAAARPGVGGDSRESKPEGSRKASKTA